MVKEMIVGLVCFIFKPACN